MSKKEKELKQVSYSLRSRKRNTPCHQIARKEVSAKKFESIGHLCLNKSEDNDSWKELSLLSEANFNIVDSPISSSTLLSNKINKSSKKRKRKSGLFDVNLSSYQKTLNILKGEKRARHENPLPSKRDSDNKLKNQNQELSPKCSGGMNLFTISPSNGVKASPKKNKINDHLSFKVTSSIAGMDIDDEIVPPSQDKSVMDLTNLRSGKSFNNIKYSKIAEDNTVECCDKILDDVEHVSHNMFVEVDSNKITTVAEIHENDCGTSKFKTDDLLRSFNRETDIISQSSPDSDPFINTKQKGESPCYIKAGKQNNYNPRKSGTPNSTTVEHENSNCLLQTKNLSSDTPEHLKQNSPANNEISPGKSRHDSSCESISDFAGSSKRLSDSDYETSSGNFPTKKASSPGRLSTIPTSDLDVISKEPLDCDKNTDIADNNSQNSWVSTENNPICEISTGKTSLDLSNRNQINGNLNSIEIIAEIANFSQSSDSCDSSTKLNTLKEISPNGICTTQDKLLPDNQLSSKMVNTACEVSQKNCNSTPDAPPNTLNEPENVMSTVETPPSINSSLMNLSLSSPNHSTLQSLNPGEKPNLEEAVGNQTPVKQIQSYNLRSSPDKLQGKPVDSPKYNLRTRPTIVNLSTQKSNKIKQCSSVKSPQKCESLEMESEEVDERLHSSKIDVPKLENLKNNTRVRRKLCESEIPLKKIPTLESTDSISNNKNGTSPERNQSSSRASSKSRTSSDQNNVSLEASDIECEKLKQLDLVVTIDQHNVNITKIVKKAFARWKMPSRLLKQIQAIDIELTWNRENMFKTIKTPQTKLKRGVQLSSDDLSLIYKRWSEFCRLYGFNRKKPRYFFITPISRRYYSPLFTEYFSAFLSQDLKCYRAQSTILRNFQNMFEGEPDEYSTFSEYDDAVIIALHKHLGKHYRFVNEIAATTLRKPRTYIVKRYAKLRKLSNSSLSGNDSPSPRKPSRRKIKKTSNHSSNSDVNDSDEITRLQNEKVLNHLKHKSEKLFKLLNTMLEISKYSKDSLLLDIDKNFPDKDWHLVADRLVDIPPHAAKALFQTKVHPLLTGHPINKYRLISDILDHLKSKNYESWNDVNWCEMSKSLKQLKPLFLFATFEEFVRCQVPPQHRPGYKDCIAYIMKEKLSLIEEKIKDEIILDVCS